MGIGAGFADFLGGAAAGAKSIIDYTVTSRLEAEADKAKQKQLSKLRKGELKYEYGLRKELQGVENQGLLEKAKYEHATEVAKEALKGNSGLLKETLRQDREDARNKANNATRMGVASMYRRSGNRPTRQQTQDTLNAVPGLIRGLFGVDTPAKLSPWAPRPQ